MSNDNGVGFAPPKKRQQAQKQDPTSIYLRTLVNQSEEIIRLLNELVSSAGKECKCHNTEQDT